MAVEQDQSSWLPGPPPPRPLAREAAIEAALRKFDGAEETPARVHVSLHNVPAEPRRGSNRALKINGRTHGQAAQSRAIERLSRAIRRKTIAAHVERSKTYAVNRDRVTVTRAFRNGASGDDYADSFPALLKAANFSELFNDTCEHFLKDFVLRSWSLVFGL